MYSVTALFASMAGVFLVVLALRVVMLRRRLGVGIGDGGDPVLSKAIRVHGNFVEYVPLALILLLLAEAMDSLAPVWLYVLGAAIIAGRLLHAAGLSRHSGRSHGRFFGSGLTWAAMLVLCVANLWSVIG